MASVKLDKAKKPTARSEPAQTSAKAAAIMKMLTGGSLRVSILRALLDGERSAAVLCELLDAARPTIARNVSLLRHVGLVQAQRLGQPNMYSLTGHGETVARCLDEILREKPHGRSRETRSTRIDKELLEDVGAFVDNPGEWFHTPNPEFEGQRPVDMLGTREEPGLRYRIAAASMGAFS